MPSSYPSIERAAYEEFLKRFKDGQYEGQRLGQAFFNEFKLHKTKETKYDLLYELDGERAKGFIYWHFDLH